MEDFTKIYENKKFIEKLNNIKNFEREKIIEIAKKSNILRIVSDFNYHFKIKDKNITSNYYLSYFIDIFNKNKIFLIKNNLLCKIFTLLVEISEKEKEFENKFYELLFLFTFLYDESKSYTLLENNNVEKYFNGLELIIFKK